MEIQRLYALLHGQQYFASMLLGSFRMRAEGSFLCQHAKARKDLSPRLRADLRPDDIDMHIWLYMIYIYLYHMIPCDSSCTSLYLWCHYTIAPYCSGADAATLVRLCVALPKAGWSVYGKVEKQHPTAGIFQFFIISNHFFKKASPWFSLISRLSGASMIRTKGEAGTGDVVEAVRHIRTLHKEPPDLPDFACLEHVSQSGVARRLLWS